VKNVDQHNLIHWDNQLKTSMQQSLLREEPLSIRVEGNPYAVVMRTPGDEIAHVAGFCLTEGIIDSPDDLTARENYRNTGSARLYQSEQLWPLRQRTG
jgi:formate dehydrogenase assembly factor FdhD